MSPIAINNAAEFRTAAAEYGVPCAAAGVLPKAALARKLIKDRIPFLDTAFFNVECAWGNRVASVRGMVTAYDVTYRKTLKNGGLSPVTSLTIPASDVRTISGTERGKLADRDIRATFAVIVTDESVIESITSVQVPEADVKSLLPAVESEETDDVKAADVN